MRTDGRGGEVTRTFRTKDAATAWAHADAAATVPVTVAEWAATWQARQVHQRGRSRETIRLRVEGDIIPVLGGRRLDSLTRADVQDAVLAWTDKELAPATVRLSYRYLSSMLREAVLEGIIPVSPAVRIRLPALPSEPVEVLTVGQVQQIADTIAPWARDAVLVAAATGLRPGEWRGLTADRVNLEAGTVLVDRQIGETVSTWGPLKTAASRRVVTVGPATVDVLGRLVEDADGEGRLFHHRGGWSRHRLYDVWDDVRGKLSWMGPGGWHLLRHHHASVLLSGGASVVAVSRRLGHKDATETLATYAHVMPADDALLADMADGLVR
ncbi:Integrase [Micrococcus lylae]|uniref:Integrase n=1 Tax=Micrococcus lylae TaxID=1273 RepID=A0A1R4JAB1_9MICC|nr:Integrase [Micrococcus lylae]